MVKRHTAFGVLVAVLLLMGWSACSGDSVVNEPATTDPPMPPPGPATVSADVAFVNVNIVPMDADRMLESQTVLVGREGIVQIGPTDQVAIPDSALRIDGTGQYLLPGLTDMHVHWTANTTSELRNDNFLFLANGVTTIRVMWGSNFALRRRDEIIQGLALGPTVYIASPGMDGPGGPWNTPAVTTTSQAQQTVRQYKADGFDFIKVYNALQPPIYRAIIDEARAQNIRVVGHVPGAVGIETVLASGQASLEHFIGFRLAASSPFTGGTLDLAEIARLAALSRDAGAWHTPTNTVDGLSRSDVRRIRNSEAMQYMSPGMTEFIVNGFYQGFADEVAAREKANHHVLTRTIHEASGRVLIGTDAGFGYMIPGFSIHDELQSFVDAGLTPYEALEAATSGAARFLEAEDVFGIVAEGFRADLLLVQANPLDDLAHLQRRSGVMVRGQWFSEDEIQQRLEAINLSYNP